MHAYYLTSHKEVQGTSIRRKSHVDGCFGVLEVKFPVTVLQKSSLAQTEYAYEQGQSSNVRGTT